MKKLFMFLVILFILISKLLAQDDCEGIPQKMEGKWVFDYYNKIENKTEAQLEDLLRRYNDSTSIEMIIVTLKEIGDRDGVTYASNIGNCWKIGKAKYDNGIVILVSFEGNRAWAIATGKGMNQYLTDYTASSIGQENLIPNLQNGDIDRAFEKTVNAIIDHLGWRHWEVRDYWTKWDEESYQLKRSYNGEATSRGFGIFFTWLLYLSLLSFIGWCIWMWSKEIRARAKVKFSIQLWDNEINSIPTMTRDNSWPKWVIKDFKNLFESSKKEKGDYVKGKSEVLRELKNNPENAYNLAIKEIYPIYKKLTLEIPKRLSELIERKQYYEKNAFLKVKEVSEVAVTIQNTLKSYIAKGFQFADSLANVVEIKQKTLDFWEKRLSMSDSIPDSFKEGYDVASDSQEQIRFIVDTANSLVSDHDKISSEYTSLNTKILDLKKDKKSQHEKILEGLKKVHPKNVWRDHEEDFLKIDKALSEAKSSLDSAVEKNKILEVDSLQNAEKLYTDALALIEWIEKVYNEIDATSIAQKNAKSEYSSLESSAKTALENAVSECKKEHVDDDTKNELKEAETRMEEARNMLVSGIVDWVLLLSIIKSVKEKAESSYSKASSDISSYNRAHSYSHTTHTSTYTHHSSPGGGGSFGRSGAGGHW